MRDDPTMHPPPADPWTIMGTGRADAAAVLETAGPPPLPSLSESRKLRFLTLCALYFAQGIPWGFVSIALLAVLSASGLSQKQTAMLVTVASLPWTFKFIWGPTIDSVRIPSLGRRRPWIVFAQLMMALTLLVSVSGLDLSTQSAVTLLAAIFFAHNCFASLQDVATDALAVDLLDDDERARANAFMWASKLLGLSIGGAGMATVMSRWGIESGMRVQAALILAIMLLPLMLRERPGEKLFPWSVGRASAASTAASRTNPLRVFRELFRAMAMRTTFLGLFVAGLAYVGEGLSTPVTAELFTQHLGWSAEQLSHAQGIWGTVGKVAGALLGGFLADRFGCRRIACIGIAIAAATFLGFGLTSALWKSDGYPLTQYFAVLDFGIAMTSVSFLAMFMNISWTAAAATQFTLYMTVCNIGSTGGPLLTRLGLGYESTFVLCAALTVLPLLLLPLLNPAAIARRRLQELESLETEVDA